VKSEVVQEYGAKVTLYRHRQTQTEVMSVSVDDENKVGREGGREGGRKEVKREKKGGLRGCDGT